MCASRRAVSLRSLITASSQVACVRMRRHMKSCQVSDAWAKERIQNELRFGFSFSFFVNDVMNTASMQTRMLECENNKSTKWRQENNKNMLFSVISKYILKFNFKYPPQN